MDPQINNVTTVQQLTLQNLLILENVFKFVRRRDILSHRLVHSTWLRVASVISRERKLFKLTFRYCSKVEDYRLQSFKPISDGITLMDKAPTTDTPVSSWSLIGGPLSTGDVYNFVSHFGNFVLVLDISFEKYGMLMDQLTLWRIITMTPNLVHLSIQYFPSHWLGCDWEIMFSPVSQLTLEALASRHRQLYLDFVTKLAATVPRIAKFETTCPGSCCQKFQTTWPGQVTSVKPRYGQTILPGSIPR